MINYTDPMFDQISLPLKVGLRNYSPAHLEDRSKRPPHKHLAVPRCLSHPPPDRPQETLCFVGSYEMTRKLPSRPILGFPCCAARWCEVQSVVFHPLLFLLQHSRCNLAPRDCLRSGIGTACIYATSNRFRETQRVLELVRP